MRRLLAGMIVAAVAVFVARPELFEVVLWDWYARVPTFMPRSGLRQSLDLYIAQLIALGYEIVWVAVALVAVEAVRETRRWLSRPPLRFLEP